MSPSCTNPHINKSRFPLVAISNTFGALIYKDLSPVLNEGLFNPLCNQILNKMLQFRIIQEFLNNSSQSITRFNLYFNTLHSTNFTPFPPFHFKCKRINTSISCNHHVIVHNTRTPSHKFKRFIRTRC